MSAVTAATVIAGIGAAATVASATGILGGKPKASQAQAQDNSAQEAILSQQESRAAQERQRLAEEQSARTRAARRGGFRGLLSSERLNPETGLSNTLGPS